VLAGKGMDYRRLAELMQGRTEVFNRVPDMVRFLNELPEYDLEIYTHKKMKTDVPVSLDALQMMKPVLKNVADWTEASIHEAVMAAIEASGKKNGTVLWPLRIAISGQANTPGGAIEIAYLLGKAETLRRVEDGIRRLEKA
jgi:glutamyl-tRNA synthetase